MQTITITKATRNYSVTGIPSEQFAAIRFVLDAIAKQPARYALGMLKVEQGRIIATDGRRLHIADIDMSEALHKVLDGQPLEQGTYAVIKNNTTTIILEKQETDAKGDTLTYPNIEDVIPKRNKHIEIEFNPEVPTSSRIAYALGRVNAGFFNGCYLECFNALGVDDGFRVFFSEKGRPIVIEAAVGDTDIMAIIMPITSDDDNQYCVKYITPPAAPEVAQTEHAACA